METLTSSANKLSADAWKALSALTRREFYDGELESTDAEGHGYTLQKALSYPISLTRVLSRHGFSYRRSWNHIRGNNVGFRLIFFVIRGGLKIARTKGLALVPGGSAIVINTNQPFQATSMCDESGEFESFQALVPADLFLAHLKAADELPSAFSFDSPDGDLLRSLLDIIVAQGETIGRAAAKPLAEALLESVAQCIGSDGIDSQSRKKLVDRRFSDIENYILMNVTDPELSYDKVAASCGISSRYLCYLLKAHNTSFSDLLWKNRLPKAREWLISPATRDYPIHEISFMSGFKSAAHFSRMFKAAYGCPPSEYRALYGLSSEATVDSEGSMKRAA